jgi:hypothetical protein
VDALTWIWWALTSLLGIVWSLLWFLIGGWVSALAQIFVVALVIFGMKYGWQRAPFELWARAKVFGKFVWNWILAKEGSAPQTRVEVRETVRVVRVKEVGDVNLSTLLSALTLVGLLTVGAL